MISNLVVKQTYTGNGTARNWPIPFSYTDTSQIKVKLTVNGAETLVPSSDYTVGTVAQNVVYPKTADPIPATTKITLYRETAKTQATDLTNQGALYPETLEASFDKLIEIVQEQAEQIGRAVKTQISSSTSPDELMAELTAGAAAAVAAAGAAATSETNAAGSATAAANSAASALTSQTAAAASQTAAATSETNAGASATAAANSAASALTSKTAAATSETNAANSAAAALASKTAAATSETNAAASQSAAAGSQVAAANSAAAAQASADTANAYAGAVNCILRGLKISAVNGFSVSVDSGVVLANEVRKAVAAGSVTMSARKAALIYADNTGALGKVDAKYPTDYIDDNTIGLWVFNKSGNIPNSAVGLSKLAVANDLVPSGGITVVDGHADYAAMLNGTDGYYKGSNLTNFPSGAAEFEHTVGFTANAVTGTHIIMSYGSPDGSSGYFTIQYGTDKQVLITNSGTSFSTGFYLDVSRDHTCTVRYSSGKIYVLIDGIPISPGAVFAFSIALTYNLILGAYTQSSTPIYFAPITLHYLEIRNKVRTDAKAAEIANKFIIPCFYTDANGKRRSIIEDIVPANAVAVAYVKTSTSGVSEFNDLWPMYGRREGATGGNRKQFLPWQPFSGEGNLKWTNPFGNAKYKREVHWAQDANGKNEMPCVPCFYNSTAYGVLPVAGATGYNDAQNINVWPGAGGVVNFNGVWQTTGYIGGYAEMLEDYTGVV